VSDEKEIEHMNNSVTLVGNLTDDPELRFIPSGTALANVSFAVNRSYKDRNDEWQEETSFFRGTCWREMAEHAAESLTKGTRVIVTGRLKQRSYETKEGDKRSVVEVQIDDIGPSLRWATATVTRTPRASGPGDFDRAQAPAAPVARTEFGPDEAPF
jgi:single-strand DNA-binding protein